jgi:predicted translin family RNA/ssDNA-binding protein
MSTIEEVRAAEKKVQEVLEALKKAGAQYPNDLGTELKNATDEYARAVRELSSWLRTKARRVAG